MRNMTIQSLSMKEKNYKVLDSLSISIRVDENPYSLPVENIFSLAARNNPKRSYLFVSKLIGKHIPVPPCVPMLTGYLLAARFAEKLGQSINNKYIQEAVNSLVLGTKYDLQLPSYQFPGKALFIGFAETATALGHAVFNCFMGDTRFIHTTRENIEGSQDTIYFTEDHCHAPEQRLLVNDLNSVTDNDMLVLIDDEITSGNTCLNIIKNIQNKYPQKKYTILTILDWRSELAKENYNQLQEELGVQIDVISLIAGSFWAEGDSPFIKDTLITMESTVPKVQVLNVNIGQEVEVQFLDGTKGTFLGCTGRFGLDFAKANHMLAQTRVIGERLSCLRSGNMTLCLGTGEFMYIPFQIARYMGEGVLVQSTTRSPVHPYAKEDYAVKYAITFEDPFRPGVKNFIYNIPPNYYDEVFVFWERAVRREQVAPLVHSLRMLGIANIVFVNFCE